MTNAEIVNALFARITDGEDAPAKTASGFKVRTALDGIHTLRLSKPNTAEGFGLQAVALFRRDYFGHGATPWHGVNFN
jgi:hypothetical protein